MKKSVTTLLSMALLSLVSAAANAAGGGGGGGGWAFGGAVGIVAASQDDINKVISTANAGEAGISTSQLGNAYEGYGFIEYRFGGSWLAFQFRPSFFYQNQTGKNAGGEEFNYSVKGYTVFPMARFYMLENANIKFFSQVGIGFGVATGTIDEQGNSLSFKGADMGYVLGLGAEFCLTGGNHCMSVEGNMRYLKIARLVADSVSGSSFYALTQSSKGQEVEIGGGDLGVTMSGIQGFLGYAFHF